MKPKFLNPHETTHLYEAVTELPNPIQWLDIVQIFICAALKSAVLFTIKY